ncbi:PepSY domain-containing protein [Nocardia sp. NPDC049190]|uniref:PepSY domain-containing protein n=1 Tax=Nocardia sp. NPDC049190 TaxID=3155650 RepID=UPI0033F13F05
MTTVLRRAFAGLRWVIVGATAAVVVAGGSLALAAFATGGNYWNTVSFEPSESNWSLVANSTVTRQQAIDTAVDAVPGGRVTSAEIDKEAGTAVWEVELTSPDGVEHEVIIDASSGKVLSTVNHD